MSEDWKKFVKLEENILKTTEQELEKQGYQKLQFIDFIDQEQHLTAYSLKHQQRVILRISQNSQEEYDKLQKEYVIMQQLKSYKNIILVFDMIVIKDCFICIIVQEYPQKNLFDEMQELKNKNKLHTAEVMTEIILQISHAICMIHYNKISHQHINSKNIIISSNGTYKLSNFKHCFKIPSHQSDLFQAEGYIYEIKDQQKQLDNKNNHQNYLFYQKDIQCAGRLFLEIIGCNLNNNNDIKQIQTNIYKQNINEIQYQNIQQIIKNKFLTSDVNDDFQSYDIINKILPWLPFTQSNLQRFIPIIYEVDNYETFDNGKNPPFLLNIQLQYLKTLSFIYEKIKNIPVKLKAEVLSCTASKLTEMGMYEKSNQYRQQSLILYNQIKSSSQKDIIFQYQQICYNYKQLKEYKTSLVYGKKALKLAKKINKSQSDVYAKSLLELSWCYKAFGKEKKGLKLAIKAKEIYEKIYKDYFVKEIGDCLCTIACMKSGLKQFEESINYYQKSIEVFQKIYNFQEHPDISACFENLGVAYENQGDIQMSVLYYEDCLKMNKFLFGDKSNMLSSCYKKLCRVYRKQNREQEALKIERELQKIEQKI
ncbi:tetratricopeptide repeat protein (macronuclear) [Tetrahymena thermophila SB210]|uniref:Tetratricopeptide repeat protein n=1 Tax=Tetrahymena thermophila (strain SB210) TaxID=312017 RepID=I7LZG5_TETTS|nr:tetratricopeptide repeat protein [Tetrahymena thermophila SB210]EAR83840.1 tetratricopeptide repeat protein [Tetrahymena thermophila SB210]|eukprot:XP_001031503.1 tetratricopeptide repeat protein [Tetrahymena thermophila SB210]